MWLQTEAAPLPLSLLYPAPGLLLGKSFVSSGGPDAFTLTLTLRADLVPEAPLSTETPGWPDPQTTATCDV